MSLSSDFALVHQNTRLIDRELGNTHLLVAPAGSIVKKLRQGIVYKQFRAACRLFGISDTQCAELLGFLNVIGALTIQRRTIHRTRTFQIQLHHRLLGVRYAPVIWRRSVRSTNLAIGLLRATWIVVLAMLVVCQFFSSSGLIEQRIAYQAFGFSCSLFLASLYVHEHAHHMVAQYYGHGSILLQQGMRLSVAHRRLAPKAEFLSAFLGPICGTIIALTIAVSTTILLHQALALAIGIAVSCVHLGSLLPWYGDGKSATQAFKLLRERSS